MAYRGTKKVIEDALANPIVRDPIVRALGLGVSPSMIADLLKKLAEGRSIIHSPPLVLGMFPHPDDQVRFWRKWAERFDPSLLEKLRFLRDPPSWPDASTPFRVVVLTYRDPEPRAGLALLFELVRGSHPDMETFAGFRAEKCLIIDTARYVGSMGFQWSIVDLVMGHGEILPESRTQHPADVELLALAALAPQWIRSMDGSRVPFVRFPGIRGPEGTVPSLQFSAQDVRPQLFFGIDDPNGRAFSRPRVVG